MRSKTEQAGPLAALLLAFCFGFVSTTHAQVGEAMEDLEEDDATDSPGAERIAPTDTHDDDGDDADEDADSDPSVDDWATEPPPEPFPYRVGADLGLEVGGHILASFFTFPRLPHLNTGLGFQGRVATHVYGDLVGEANVGIMFNPDNGGDGTYKNAMLRVGARYPIDLQAKPFLFFIGAGAALDILSVTTNVGDKSAITPAFDLQFGIMWELHDRLAVEAIVQGNYAFSNVVFLNQDASWFAVLGGVSYDL